MSAGRQLNRSVAFFLIVASALAVSFGPRAAEAEIPAGADVPTSRDYIAQETEFFKRIILEPYIANRDKGGATANEAEPGEQFLRLWVENASEGFGSTDTTALVNKGKQAIDAGCKDAMFSYCYGRLMRAQGDLEASAKHLQFALDNLESGGYDVSFCSWSANHLASVLRALQRHPEAQPLAEREIEALVKTIVNGSYHPDEQSLFYRHIEWVLENSPIDSVATLVDEINAKGQLYPWLTHMASSHLEVRRAWKARGGGWASEVTKEGWKGFETHMTAAHEHLSEAWNLNPQWPESATKMITVAMAGHVPEQETERFWFDRAVAAQLDYRPAYSAYMWSLMPRWGGSHQELYEFGRECLDTGRFDTHVPYSFLEAFQYILYDMGSNLDYYKLPGVYDDLQALCDGYLAEPAMEWHHYWYRTLKVSVAARCEKWEDARRFLLAMNHQPHEEAFTRLGLKTEETIGEIYARSGELAEPHAEAERLAAAGNYDEAKSKYEELVIKTGEQQRVTTFFRGRVRDVEFDRDFSAGKWTKLPLDETLSGWRNLGGKWSVDAQGRLVGEARTQGLKLMFEKALGTQFELRGKAVFVSQQHPQCNMGVYFGQETGRLPNSFRIFGEDNYAAVLKDDRPLQQKTLTVEDANSFRVERRDDAITAYVNDELVASDVEIEPYGPPTKEVIALGGRYWYRGPVVRFENLEVRKLAPAPGDEAKQTAADKSEQGEPAEAAQEAQLVERRFARERLACSERQRSATQPVGFPARIQAAFRAA